MKKSYLPFFFCLSLCSSAYASVAVEFAKQAGAIAGAAQACGLQTNEFTNRYNLAQTILATDTTDLRAAQQTYNDTRAMAQQQQLSQSSIPCTQVIQDFNGLPIMQPDYRTNVLEKMRAINNRGKTFLPTQNPPPNVVQQQAAPQNNGALPPMNNAQPSASAATQQTGFGYSEDQTGTQLAPTNNNSGNTSMPPPPGNFGN